MPIVTALALPVTNDQRAELKRMAGSSSLPHPTVMQAKALLWAADEIADQEIARRCVPWFARAMPRVHSRGMCRCVARVALFSLVGVGFLLFWVRQESGWRAPLATSEPEVVVAFTGLLLALGLALWHFGAIVSVRRVRRAAAAPGVAAAVCAVANVMEDGIGVESAFFLFITASLVLLLGQFLLAMVVLRATGSWLLAAIPGISGLALALYPPLGGPLMLCAWGLAAVSAGRTNVAAGTAPAV